MSKCEHRQRRKRSLVLAVATSLLSKGGNALLQLLAMPVAYAELGKERFGVFGALQSVMWLIYLSDLGVSGGVSRRLTAAVARDDREEQTSVISSGTAVTLVLAIVAGILGALLLCTVPVSTLFGQKFDAYADELSLNLWLALGLFLAMVMTASLLKIREAFQELHYFNTYGAVANVISAVLLFVGIRWFPEVWYLLVALYGVQLLSYVINCLTALSTRPWLTPKLSAVKKPLVKLMLVEGLAFFVVLSLAPILEREGVRWLIGQEFGPETVGLYSILIQLGFFLFGFVVMFTSPLLPAVADAATRRDYSWIRSLRRRMFLLFCLGAAGTMIFLAYLGPQFVDLWMRQDIPLNRTELVVFGLYFLCMVWTHLNSILLAGCGLIRPAAVVLAVECAAVFSCAWAGMHQAGLLGALLASSVGILAVSAWILPVLLRRFLHAHEIESASPQAAVIPPAV